MKNLIKKILRESDDWDWVRDIVSDERITKDSVEVGMRVRINPDSEFAGQTKPNGHGTVSHINDEDFPKIDDDVKKYWVYVNWDDGGRNSYRVGNAEFDLLFPNEKPPITESDEFDWIRDVIDQPINPWEEYDAIIFDVVPTKEDVNMYIEMCLNTKDVKNATHWVDRRDDILAIISYVKNRGNAYLSLVMDYLGTGDKDSGSDLLYGYDLYRDQKSIKYSELKAFNLNESDDLDWIRTTEPTRIQKNKSYIMTTYDLQQFLTTVERELPLATWCSGDKPTQYTPIAAKLKNRTEHYIKIIIDNYDKLSYSHSGSEDFSNSTNWP